MSKNKQAGFTLVELLVVIGIIGLLISILLPTLNSARNAAKKSKTTAELESMRKALELFQNETGDFPESRKQLDPTDVTVDPQSRTVNNPGNNTTIWGAQLLARTLVGRDYLGYVNPKKARNFDATLAPTEWYDNPTLTYRSRFPREDVFFNDRSSFWRAVTNPVGPFAEEKTVQGVRPASGTLLDQDDNDQLLIVDVFERPILYYKANPRGNVMCDATADAAGFSIPNAGDPTLVPIYNLLDNDLFTGAQSTQGTTNFPVTTSSEPGWLFGADPNHQLKELGDPIAPDTAVFPVGFYTTFSKYIHDHKAERAAGGVVRPVNPDSYLLISAGVDGVYGSDDDIKNFVNEE